MNKKISLIVLIIVVVVLFISLFSSKKGAGDIADFEECMEAGYPIMESYPRRCVVPKGGSWTEDIGNVLLKADVIRLLSPLPGDKVMNPVGVSGTARGYWFFEASAPVEIVDSDGKILGRGIIQAKDNWMTEEFVPFEGEIIFANPKSGKGQLILKRDNPSDLPENDDSLNIPIYFK